MIHFSDSKPSRKSTTALSFTYSASSLPSQSQPVSAKEEKKSQESKNLDLENVCPTITAEHFQKNPQVLAGVLKNNSKIARKGKTVENDEDQELFEISQIARDTTVKKTCLKQEIEETVADSQRKIQNFMEKIEKDNDLARDYQKQAEKFTESIEKIQGYSEVLKELFSMEIVDVTETPKTMTIISSYGSAFVRYSLSDSENPEVFIYRYIGSNIEFPGKYGYLLSNIEFEKKDLTSFYLSIMDSIYINS
jgi:hypothetical protein